MYASVEEILVKEKESGLLFWQIVCEADCIERNVSKEECFTQMQEIYKAMKASEEQYDPMLRSHFGLVGGEAQKLHAYREAGKLLSGDLIGQVMEKALKIAESNACMKRIVAAPTAGSCGVVPAVFLAIQEKCNFSDEEMTKALFVSAGIGGVIAQKASLSGAQGGCQAEIGSASAMAAGGLVFLLGGSGEQIANGAALALKNLLGLACDPVAGLVEVPCVKRNVMGAVNAVTSAELSMAGIYSKIPVDEVFEAMGAIGRGMSDTIKETARGGLAATRTGQRLQAKLESTEEK